MTPRIRRRRAAAAGMLMVLALAAPRAHDLAQSESRLELQGTTVRSTTLVDLLELSHADADQSGRVSYDELDRGIVSVFDLVKSHLVLTAAVPPARITLERHELIDDHVLRMVIDYRYADAVARLQVTSTLDQIGKPEHQHLVSAVVNGELQQAVLDRTNRSVELNLRASRITWPRVLAVLGALALIGGRFAFYRSRGRSR